VRWLHSGNLERPLAYCVETENPSFHEGACVVCYSCVMTVAVSLFPLSVIRSSLLGGR
jgi:hypothetical protein